MAHPQNRRTALRAAYCFKAQTLEQAASMAGVSVGTARRWRTDALRNDGDDWDKIRAASNLAGEGMEVVTRQALNDFVIQYRLLMDQISSDEIMPAADKINALSSLADSFAKTVAASKRVLPEMDRLAAALEVIRKLVDFTQRHFPHHAPVMLEILEPFGALIEREMG